MSDKSAIEWTDATWNPTTGCTKISPGCAHCYIERTPAFRIAGRTFVNGHIPLQLHTNRVNQPLHWQRPRRVFVNSLSDLFHDDVPDQFLHDVYHVMEHARQHTFQVLTKRAERMRDYLTWRYGPDAEHPRGRIPSRHVWHGVSVENQHFADERIPLLLETSSAVRFISAEPLLGPVDLSSWLMCEACGHSWRFHTNGGMCQGTAVGIKCHCCMIRETTLDWVIVGGESGSGARFFDLSWARSIVAQCRDAGVPVFVKQLGARVTGFDGDWKGTVRRLHAKGGDMGEWPADLRVRQYPLPRGTSQTSAKSQT